MKYYTKLIFGVVVYGIVVIIVIVIGVFVLRNRKEDSGNEWKTYRNDELNIETRVPEGVEVEVRK